MSKNKIVLSVGLLAGITGGVSFAEDTLNIIPGTNLIDKKHTQSIFLTDTIKFIESVTGKHNYNAVKHYYYNFKCYINNLLYPADVLLQMKSDI